MKHAFALPLVIVLYNCDGCVDVDKDAPDDSATPLDTHFDGQSWVVSLDAGHVPLLGGCVVDDEPIEDCWQCVELDGDGQARTWWGMKPDWTPLDDQALGGWEISAESDRAATYQIAGSSWTVEDLGAAEFEPWTTRVRLILDGDTWTLYQPSGTYPDTICNEGR